jgi:hypothetical protein
VLLRESRLRHVLERFKEDGDPLACLFRPDDLVDGPEARGEVRVVELLTRQANYGLTCTVCIGYK